MTRRTKSWQRRAARTAGSAIVGTAKVADRAASGLFRYVTTDHLGVTRHLPKGLSPWQELKMVFMRTVVGIGSLLLIWGIVMAAILIFGRP